MNALTRIFYADRDEEAAKPDGTRQANILTQGCMSTYCPSQNVSLTQHPSVFPDSAVDQHEISGLKTLTLGITGGTGFIGQALQAEALSQKKNILIFSRQPQSLLGARIFTTTTIPDLSGCDQIVHLAGESIIGLWTREKRSRILESRREGTRRLVEGIAKASVKPSVLVSASAIGYYGDSGDHLLDETAPAGSGFLAEVAQIWEEEARKAEAYGVRVVLVRIGIVLGATGGMMKFVTPLFRLGLGGVLDSGQQWMSCIHVMDLVRLILKCCDTTSISGPINAVMPSPLTNATFTKTVGNLLHRPTFLHTPAIALRFGLGELSTLLLSSQRIFPAKALEHGYDFQYPTAEKALQKILQK